MAMSDAQGPWRFRVPLTVKPPTANGRLHWAQRARLVSTVRNAVALVSLCERNRLRAPKAAERRRLALTYIRPQGREAAHPLDPDQVVAAMKPCVDGLVKAGWLTDDAPRWCEYVLPVQAVGPYRAIEVEIQPCVSE